MTNFLTLHNDEPLAELTDFSFNWAHCLCDPHMGCFEYHRGWSIVRHIEANGALPSGQAFFSKALRDLAYNVCIRVLLSGASDTGLVAMVLQGLRPPGIEPEMVLVDRCLTTIEQNHLFARHAGFSLQVFQMDAAALDVPPVDAIIVHSFLGFIALEPRQPVVDISARNLSTRGRVLISNRLSVDKGTPRPAADPAALTCGKAGIAAKALSKGYSPSGASAIADAAEALWDGNPQLGETELLGSLERSGLAVVGIQKDSSGITVSSLVMDADAKRRDRAEMIVARAN